MKKSTSWGEAAIVGDYQKNLILPNLLRLMEIKPARNASHSDAGGKGEVVLDLGCGPGFFAREFRNQGAKVIGVDISKKLIESAKKESPSDISYYASSAENLSSIKDKSVDKI